ncbi:VOC family protein [Antribacter gilvus]|uniref:VOC family protein n=1 Tax=Antribacter gilvus TaxID=2304675 RepID=UPI000F77EB02|nr:VOC family protein [Antribacter gilvus]
MLRGLTTVSIFADDLNAAAAWYTELLGVEPYFEVPDAYYEFRIGDYQHELGIIDRRHAPAGAGGPQGQVVYWHVDDLDETLGRLRELGATIHEDVRDRGHGFVTATVADPFGNLLGVMTNPHYLEVLRSRG